MDKETKVDLVKLGKGMVITSGVAKVVSCVAKPYIPVNGNLPTKILFTVGTCAISAYLGAKVDSYFDKMIDDAVELYDEFKSARIVDKTGKGLKVDDVIAMEN